MPGPGAFLIGEEEIREVMDVLKGGHLSRYGREDDPNFKHKVIDFEREFAAYIGVEHCVAVSGGTSALINCLNALGVGPGDEVIVPGYTFIATMSAVIYARAIPVLCEVDESLTMDPEDFRRKITDKTKCVIPVHMLGNPCDMDAIMAIAKEHGILVLEDCCQACGATYKGKKVGVMGDMAAYSLNIFKTITAGDGGMLVTNNKDYYTRAFAFHDQGHFPMRMGAEIGKRTIVGINMRVNELTGAVALAQQRKLDSIIKTLREKKRRLKSQLTGIKGFSFRKINDEDECGTLLTLLFDTKELADQFCAKVGTTVIENSGWHVYSNMEQILNKNTTTAFPCPYICPAYGRDIQYDAHMLEKTDDLLLRAVNISIGVVDSALGAGFGINILSTDEEIDQVAKNIRAVMEEITK